MHALVGRVVVALTLGAGIAAGQTPDDGRPSHLHHDGRPRGTCDWRVVTTAAAAFARRRE
jgi:hypothetical protein